MKARDYLKFKNFIILTISNENCHNGNEIINKLRTNKKFYRKFLKGKFSNKELSTNFQNILKNLVDDNFINGKYTLTKDGYIFHIDTLTSKGYTYIKESSKTHFLWCKIKKILKKIMQLLFSRITNTISH